MKWEDRFVPFCSRLKDNSDCVCDIIYVDVVNMIACENEIKREREREKDMCKNMVCCTNIVGV